MGPCGTSTYLATTLFRELTEPPKGMTKVLPSCQWYPRSDKSLPMISTTSWLWTRMATIYPRTGKARTSIFSRAYVLTKYTGTCESRGSRPKVCVVSARYRRHSHPRSWTTIGRHAHATRSRVRRRWLPAPVVRVGKIGRRWRKRRMTYRLLLLTPSKSTNRLLRPGLERKADQLCRPYHPRSTVDLLKRERPHLLQQPVLTLQRLVRHGLLQGLPSR